jgi:hypothetical protein
VRKSDLTLYNEIIDNISQQIRERFTNLEKIKFLEIFDCQKRNEHKNNFPEVAFQSLKLNDGQHFDFPGLQRKLITAYSIEDFSGKSVSDTVTFFRQTGLTDGVFHKHTNCAVSF